MAKTQKTEIIEIIQSSKHKQINTCSNKFNQISSNTQTSKPKIHSGFQLQPPKPSSSSSEVALEPWQQLWIKPSHVWSPEIVCDFAPRLLEDFWGLFNYLADIFFCGMNKWSWPVPAVSFRIYDTLAERQQFSQWQLQLYRNLQLSSKNTDVTNAAWLSQFEFVHSLWGAGPWGIKYVWEAENCAVMTTPTTPATPRKDLIWICQTGTCSL